MVYKTICAGSKHKNSSETKQHCHMNLQFVTYSEWTRRQSCFKHVLPSIILAYLVRNSHLNPKVTTVLCGKRCGHLKRVNSCRGKEL
jgi:hypothetical protein